MVSFLLSFPLRSSHASSLDFVLTQVDGQLSQVSVELTGETKGGGDTGHDDGDQVVEVTVAGGRELQSTEADVVQSLVIDTEGLVRVLDQLVDGEGGVVWLDNGIGDLFR